MFLLIDNYDSFTYNLVQAFATLENPPHVIRNDVNSLSDIIAMNPIRIAISPGPGTPHDSGISLEVIRKFGLNRIPILGICLGHQCIAEVFGGKIIRSIAPMHGKTSLVNHNETGLFKNIPNPFPVMRYHSLVVEEPSLPPELSVTARSEDGTIMALEHRELPIFGVQFHPESILTPDGITLLKNFLRISECCA